MNIENLVMFLVSLCAGLVISSLGFDLQGKIEKKNCDLDLQKANMGVVVLGAVMVAASGVATYFTAMSCCGTNSDTAHRNRRVFYFFVMMLSIVLTALGAIIRNKSTPEDDDKQCPETKDGGNRVMIIGIVGIVLTMAPIVVGMLGRGYKKVTTRKAVVVPQSEKKSSAEPERAFV
tara:strand:+ start:1357 stop:1884 length:528 start_codon:yes stop_codon:yes gene_type:complete